MPTIHATAVVHPDAEVASGVEIGPYAVVEAPVILGEGTTLGPHAVVLPYSRIGKRNRIHAHAIIGDVPQDLGYGGEPTWVEIGDENVIREGATIHRSSTPGEPTRVGSGCYVMAYVHIGHNCRIGDGVILANNVLLGGHVEVGDRAVLGGGAAFHQFVRVGPVAIVAGMAGANKDVLPFTVSQGAPAKHFDLNTVGLRRLGVRGERYRVLETALRRIRAGKPFDDLEGTPEIAILRAWLLAPSKRGLGKFVRGDSADS